ncbi:hypothetical protein GXW83_04500 [Streptacidiphilus sp. PB12-B1b]|uniref:hypothetical protein n=1 Tax=Streptacidiphilus sp. PB12-B1b TaxID=2705012 RepID=UPI0015FAB314|nr:hypothetical protein [Streptacidiphilus sp. PB12-B1b]QMU75131.1 hypothetical protein GXW83_04500 [Streptacidiphilus sp. PB12-B1b]
MAMIEQLSPRLRDALTRRAVPYAGGAATLLITLLMGLGPLWLHLTTSYGYLLIPAALGAPTLLPGLRLSPLGDQSGATVVCDDFAAVVMVVVVAAVLGRHTRIYPNSSRLHRLLTGWAGLVLAGFAAGFFRGLVVARLVAGGPLAYFGYPALGALFGAVWSLALGWIPGTAAAFATDSMPLWHAAARRSAVLRRRFLVRVYVPATVAAAKAGLRAIAAWRAWTERRAVAAAARTADAGALGSGAVGTGAVGAGAVRTRGAALGAEARRIAVRAARATADAAGEALWWAEARWDRLVAARVLSPDTWRRWLRRARPRAVAFARGAALLCADGYDWLRPFVVRAARACRRLGAAAAREARALRGIRLGELRGVRSLSDLRALRGPRGEKHEASRMTTP